MLQSDAWLEQARSDYAAAERLYQCADSSLYCHVIAKIQQCIEKTVKGLAALLLRAQIGRGHDVSRYLTLFNRGPHARRDRGLQSTINRVFDQEVRSVIEKLDQVFPRWPAPGQDFIRNTEYPFQANAGWKCPSAEGVFLKTEVDEFRSVAHKVVNASIKLRSIAARAN